MKPVELMKEVLGLPLEIKETFFLVLGHTIKTESHVQALTQAESAEESAIGAALVDAVPELAQQKKAPGAPRDPNSARSLVEAFLIEHKSAFKSKLRALLMEKKGWNKQQADGNLATISSNLKLVRQGFGDNGIWSLPEAKQIAA
jgi:hypothetical protein